MSINFEFKYGKFIYNIFKEDYLNLHFFKRFNINNITMISKDADLIAEAYLSALQKIHNAPTDSGTESIAEVNPEMTDRENVESPVAMTVSVPAGPEAMGAMDQGSGAEIIAGSDENHEEAEEHWMVRSNLFSLFTNAKKIHNLAQMGLDLEPWAQQKVAVCADNLEAVMKYVAYEAAEKGLQC